MTTQQMRETFLFDTLFQESQIDLFYCEVERAIIGSAVPTSSSLKLEPNKKEMAADYFCQRRELGVLNIGGQGSIKVDSKEYQMENLDALYISKGTEEIEFASKDIDNAARFYLASYPAHKEYPTKQGKKKDAQPIELGSDEKCNKRVIYKYICPGAIESSQLCMGFTQLEKGSIWNTMPTHTHQRRMEVYMYFGLEDDEVVFHLMGQPDQTRHIVMRNGNAVISPSWSIHSGAGTSDYSFVWCMGGENQTFDDMDHVKMSQLK
jgi:4-deoxy-L-threo-5-hexosulose-uronate ketol-isomerase